MSTVLIVEDHPLHAKLFSEALRSQGYHPVTAATGGESVAMAASVKPQAILIDILLPDIDGREVIARLRRRPESASLPIVAISAAGDRAMSDECLTVGADAFIAKPVRLSELFDKVAQLIGAAGN